MGLPRTKNANVAKNGLWPNSHSKKDVAMDKKTEVKTTAIRVAYQKPSVTKECKLAEVTGAMKVSGVG